MSHYYFIVSACIFWCIWVSAGYAVEKSESVSASVSASYSVEDYAGRNVSLASPAQRIVALAPHIVENLYSAGAKGRIVATVDYSDFPAEAKSIPRVGGYSNFSLESIVAFSPDLVITWGSGNGAFGATMNQLEALGIAVYVDDPHTLGDVARSIRDYGILVGQTDVANLAVENYLHQLATLRQTYSRRDTVSVFYQIWYEPLQTLNGAHIISDVLRLCGGSNIFENEPVIAPKINIESVLARDPDAIIASGTDQAGQQWLKKWLQWPSLRAVGRGQLFSVEPDLLHRHTQRILQGARALCEQLDSTRAK